MIEVNRAARQYAGLSTSLVQVDLLNDFEGLVRLLPGQLQGQRWLDAYLLAAGINQILEDYLHPDPLSLRRVAKRLRRLPWPAGALSAALAGETGDLLTNLGHQLQDFGRLVRWQRTWAGQVTGLARLAIGPASPGGSHPAKVPAMIGTLLEQTAGFPAGLRQAVLRLPSCFRSFDQHPDDLDRLAGEFARLVPARARLLVVGVRTSGSYLAPLTAASIEQQGYLRVETLTIRPGRPLLKHEQSAVTALVREGGLALVTDDPPTTGGSLAAAVGTLERAGLPAASVVLMLQLFGDQTSLPDRLRPYRSVVLPWEEWSVHRRLEPPAVTRTLSELLAPAVSVRALEPVAMPRQHWVRSHARALYRAQLADRNGHTWQETILVKGTGLGYFGEHALAVARALHEYVPKTFGVQDGLVYRAWLPEAKRVNVSSEPHNVLAGAIAGYVTERSRRLSTGRDVTGRLGGQGPAWEAASDIASSAFGRAGLAMRPLAIDRLIKGLLEPVRPAVIDGSMDARRWFGGAQEAGQYLKVDGDERAFSNLDLYCYDPVFDLAGAATWETHAGWPVELRLAYERLSGTTVDDERWLLYQCVHLWDSGRTGRLEESEVSRASARALQRYFAGRYFADLQTPAGGPLCALDLDGVLESETLGASALTPASALGLRALLAHGYLPVLDTGRSLGEVQERCDAYRLPGGVAEYGSALYLREGGQSVDLLPPDGRAALDRLRVLLSDSPGICLDPAYQYTVRAYRLTAGGSRAGLEPAAVQSALRQAGVHGQVRAICGEAQTDFVAAAVDKGTGLLALTARLGSASRAQAGRPLALAVGDSVADLPMLRLAALAGVPAHAGAAIRTPEVRVMRHAYQAGFADAVATLLHHRPGSCPVCRRAPLAAEARLFEVVLSAREAGMPGMLWRALRLVTEVRRA